jgi:glycosyltransferase involved in cell wall biosynthesis
MKNSVDLDVFSGTNDVPTFVISTTLPRPRGTDEPFADHIRQRLERLEQLARELDEIDRYEAGPSGFTVPPGFLLSIVIPIFNERDTIETIVARLVALPFRTEVIVVDDGSTDGTSESLMPLGELPNVRLVVKPMNEGKGSAVRAGIARAQGDVVVIQDADLEYDPRDIPRLLEPILNGHADVVYGSRYLNHRGHGSSWFHRLGNRILTIASNFTTGLRLTDMETGYKVFRRSSLRNIPLQQNRFGFEPEVTAKIARRRLRLVEVPVRYNPRGWADGKKIGLRDAFAAIYCIVRYAWMD